MSALRTEPETGCEKGHTNAIIHTGWDCIQHWAMAVLLGTWDALLMISPQGKEHSI